MGDLTNKNVVIGVTGGIAAYKALDVVSRLKKMNANVDVIMTDHATEFVNPTSFQSLSLNRVITDMFKEPTYWDIEHIALAKKADIFVVVPATANIIGKIANGIADDMLTTTIMATSAKKLIAPAMNTNMLNNPIVQDNINKLKTLDYQFISTDAGRLACGDVGEGKLADTQAIVERIKYEILKNNKLKGKKVLITAGPTVEKIDPVRFISNRSTGKMGYAIAEIAAQTGAEVTLVSGPTQLKTPLGVKRIDVESADEMYDEVMKLSDADIIIKTAAVSDYRPKEFKDQKIKKDHEALTLTLAKNKDILFELGKIKKDQLLVGFAAESQNLEEYALKKLKEKNLDLIVGNDITKKDAGFKSDTNIVTIIDKHGNKQALEKLTKIEIAAILIEKIVALVEE